MGDKLISHRSEDFQARSDRLKTNILFATLSLDLPKSVENLREHFIHLFFYCIINTHTPCKYLSIYYAV